MAFGHGKESDFVVKEAPDRADYPSGMNRGSQKGKPNYRLIDLNFLTRLATHLTKGAEIYGRDNWRKANSQEELDRFHDSALRHLMQYLNGETDEDHMAAVCFNLMAAEYTKTRIGVKEVESKSSLDEDIMWLFRNIPPLIYGNPQVLMRLGDEYLYLTFLWPKNALSRKISFDEMEQVFDISCLAESIAIEINNKVAEV